MPVKHALSKATTPSPSDFDNMDGQYEYYSHFAWSTTGRKLPIVDNVKEQTPIATTLIVDLAGYHRFSRVVTQPL